ncbi:hypothetical protein Rs2_38837 [Raphanus sativus]|nr:hypothetical protein Rs2_38837 [Raphanus sativus]
MGQVFCSPGMTKSASAIKVLDLIRRREREKRIYSVKSVKALAIFASDKDLVNDMFVSYYQDLLGSENSETHQFLVDDLRNIIPYKFPSALIAEFIVVSSQEEVTATLFSIPRNKAPGPDRFP